MTECQICPRGAGYKSPNSPFSRDLPDCNFNFTVELWMELLFCLAPDTHHPIALWPWYHTSLSPRCLPVLDYMSPSLGSRQPSWALSRAELFPKAWLCVISMGETGVTEPSQQDAPGPQGHLQGRFCLLRKRDEGFSDPSPTKGRRAAVARAAAQARPSTDEQTDCFPDPHSAIAADSPTPLPGWSARVPRL